MNLRVDVRAALGNTFLQEGKSMRYGGKIRVYPLEFTRLRHSSRLQEIMVILEPKVEYLLKNH